MNIYLIGMPGSGKTTLGKKLAVELNKTFIDLDQYIEEKYLLYIDEIFGMYGEEKFREIETESLKDFIGKDYVISTGGGIVMKKANKALMDGLKIYINTPIETIEKRLKSSYDRPLLKSMTLEEIYDIRFLKYQGFADKIVSNSDDITKAVSDLVKIVTDWKNK
ncbi:shikimate kinase [Acholeplasma laidlawii]|jgi:shikimate kinase|uniref:shikimate kinase n=1 Tax=Acholeplasma laidlawii TaxID=2148 RepID=UPI0018C276B3|nr:shikimate kinase [Acholeplasma laidlawii]MBG0763052.1 shikimate kinase [Acholeplasma laidlawii]